jgi:Flp pilus assembly protein TadG
MIEFVLVLLPMLGFIGVTIDLGWAVYCRSTLQYAVREGCRYAITSQTETGLTDSHGNAYGQIDSIKYVTQHSAMGFLGWGSSAPGWNLIQVNFYAPTNLTTPLTPPTSSSSPQINQYPNIVEVTVSNFQLAPWMPIYRSHGALNFSAQSADRMESAPSSGPPNYGTGTGY